MAYEIQAQDALITPQEVVKFAPVDVHSHGEIRAEMIASAEEKIFHDCFGYDFYLDLLDNKKQYSLSTGAGLTTYVNFRENTSYSLNNYVLYKDEIYKVIKLTTGVEIPPLKTHFAEAEKFTVEKYDLLWKRYLRRILAFSINSESIMFRTIKDTADGIVRRNDEYRGIGTKEAATIRQDYKAQISTMINNAKEFIVLNKTDFPLCKFVTETCGTYCEPKRKRHHGFNTNRQ